MSREQGICAGHGCKYNNNIALPHHRIRAANFLFLFLALNLRSAGCLVGSSVGRFFYFSSDAETDADADAEKGTGRRARTRLDRTRTNDLRLSSLVIIAHRA